MEGKTLSPPLTHHQDQDFGKEREHIDRAWMYKLFDQNFKRFTRLNKKDFKTKFDDFLRKFPLQKG